MFPSRVVAEVLHLVDSDPAACDATELDLLVGVSGRVRGWLDAYDARLAQRATDLNRSPADVLAGGGRRSGRDAAGAARRGGVCGLLPDVHQALASGQVSAGHVDHLARVAANVDDAGKTELVALQPQLVAAAASMGVEQFGREADRLERVLSRDGGLSKHERNRRDRHVRRWVDRVTGMCHTHLQVDAGTDARIAAALDAAVAAARAAEQDDGLTFDQLQADGLIDLITRDRAASDTESSSSARVPEVTVLIDLDTLRHGFHDHGMSETADGVPVPPDTVRRLCCDADIVPIVLNGAGVAVDVGSQQRLATRDQRRALRAMYTTCGWPGCAVRFEACRIHHVQPWEHGGHTDLANLIPLCSTHHHLVHEGHWRLTLHPDRRIELRTPDGTVHHAGTTITRAPNGVGRHDQYSEIPAHVRRAAAAAHPPQPPPEPEPKPAETQGDAVAPTRPETGDEVVELQQHLAAGLDGAVQRPRPRARAPAA